MRNKKKYSTFVADVNRWKQHNENTKGRILRLLQFAVEKGITSFKYQLEEGAAEKDSFGIAMAESGLDRAEIQLISKFNGIKKDFSKQKIIDYVEETLLHLHSDYLDLLIIDLEENLWGEITEALQNLKNQGKVLQFGRIIRKVSEISEGEAFNETVKVSGMDFSELKKCTSTLNHQKINIFMDVFSDEFFKTKNPGLENLLYSIAPKYKMGKNELFVNQVLQEFENVHLITNASDEQALEQLFASTEKIKPRDLEILASAFNQ